MLSGPAENGGCALVMYDIIATVVRGRIFLWEWNFESNKEEKVVYGIEYQILVFYWETKTSSCNLEAPNGHINMGGFQDAVSATLLCTSTWLEIQESTSSLPSIYVSQESALYPVHGNKFF